MVVEVLAASVGPTTYAVTNPATGVRHTVAPCPALDSTFKAARLDDGSLGAPRVEYGVVRAGGHLALRLPQHGGCFAFRFPVPLPRAFGDVRAATGPAGQATLLAPMPGKVGKLLVAPGTVVAANQAVMIVEAMKMEHLIKAPGAGVVTFQVAEGDMCAADQQIATITPEKK
jgi:biotin carboxyl carrier protein